jgi:hypothetical protein
MRFFVNDESESVWKEVLVVQYNAMSWNLPEEPEVKDRPYAH